MYTEQSRGNPIVILSPFSWRTRETTTSKNLAARIGEVCDHSDACAFYDPNAICTDDDSRCRCASGFQIPDKPSLEGSLCLPVGTATFLERSDITTMVGVVGGLIVFTGLFCLALRLYSKGRFNQPADRIASAASPSGMMPSFSHGGHGIIDSRRPSRSSESTDYINGSGSRRASYSMLAPPSSLGSRRASSTSVRSQLSFRSHSSFRGYRFTRDSVRRTLSSPAESHYPPSPCKMNRHHHHHHHHQPHPLHHNSPVDDDMREDSPEPGMANSEHHLSNHI